MVKKSKRKKDWRPRHAGRPRHVDAARKPTGKVRDGKPAGPTAELLAHRAAVVGADNAIHPDAGWLIGQWHLTGVLRDPLPPGLAGSERQAAEQAQAECSTARRNAAERFRRLCEQYSRLLLSPKQPDALDPNRARGRSLRDSSCLFAKLRAEYDVSFAALQDCGRDVLIAVGRACRDEDAALYRVKRGLDALDAAHDAIKRAGREAYRAAQRRLEMEAA